MKKVSINFVTYKECLYKECHGTSWRGQVVEFGTVIL
jgi:hypothetical protein